MLLSPYRQKPALLAKCVAASLLLLVLAASSTASDHFPLTNGLVRTYHYYSYGQDGYYSTRVDGWTVIGSDSVHVVRYIGGPYNGIVEYWSENAEHDKFYHGADRIGYGGYTRRVDPPLLRIDEPLFLGKAWDSYVVVAEHETVTNAGTFHTFTIGPTGAPYDLDERRFADGIGPVYRWEREHSRYEILHSYGQTAVNAVTWGRLKQQYR